MVPCQKFGALEPASPLCQPSRSKPRPWDFSSAKTSGGLALLHCKSQRRNALRPMSAPPNCPRVGRRHLIRRAIRPDGGDAAAERLVGAPMAEHLLVVVV